MTVVNASLARTVDRVTLAIQKCLDLTDTYVEQSRAGNVASGVLNDLAELFDDLDRAFRTFFDQLAAEQVNP